MTLELLLGRGAEPGTLAFFVALALTYVLHSIVWAAAATVLIRVRAPAWSTRHAYWKLALFGPFLSALLAMGASSAVRHELGRNSELAQVEVPVLAADAIAPQRAAPDGLDSNALHTRFASARQRAGRAALAIGEGAAALGLLRFVGTALLLMTRLARRTPVMDARLLRRLAQVQARARAPSRRIVLSESSELGSPLVIGSAEICVPRAALAELSEAELDAVLAHELAHLERGDAIWFALAGLVQSVFWPHPLLHGVASRFRASAELACDDRAVELTQNPLGLAHALLQVAASASRARRLALAPTMASSSSTLVTRLRRLTSAHAALIRPARRQGARWGTALMLALGATLGGFSVRFAEGRPAQPAAPPKLAQARESSAGHRASAPDAQQQSERMAALVELEQRLSAQLAAAKQRPAAAREGSSDSVRVLELSQELRHVQQTESWLERVLADEWATWEKNQG